MQDAAGQLFDRVIRQATAVSDHGRKTLGSPPRPPLQLKKELLDATAQTSRAAQARLVPEHLGGLTEDEIQHHNYHHTTGVGLLPKRAFTVVITYVKSTPPRCGGA